MRMPGHQNIEVEEDVQSEVNGVTTNGNTEPPPENEQVFQDTDHEQPPVSAVDSRISRLEKAVVDLAQIMIEKEQEGKKQQTDANASISNREKESVQAGGRTVKLDQLRPFPKDVASNRLYQEWQKYLETFEIAMSLQEVNEPHKMANGLYMAVGDYLRDILRAANLSPRPTEDGPDCYNNFVKNVGDHLRSMTDPMLEYDSFREMKQEAGESAISFHARLVDRAKLCGYGPVAEEHMVLSQLLKGLRDREIAKAAKIFDHDAKFIVRAATRSETLDPMPEPQPGPSGSGTVFAVNRGRDTQQTRKRTFGQGNDSNSANRDNSFRSSRGRGSNGAGGHRGKKQKGFGRGKKNRCSRCNYWIHEKLEDCPALNAECYECHEEGHFAVTCRDKDRLRDHHTDNNAEDQV